MSQLLLCTTMSFAFQAITNPPSEPAATAGLAAGLESAFTRNSLVVATPLPL